MRHTASAAVALVVALAALRVFDPFSGDQALFLIGAQKMHAGGVLYRDFWDIKQPGIFLFYLAGGLVFGFTQTGLHAADLVWQMLFSIALVLGLRASLHDRRWAAFGAVAIAGAYLTGSSPWHLLQVEELAGLPLFCVGWFALEAFAQPEHRRALAGLSGCAAGIAILFKLLFVGIALAVASTAVALASRRAGRNATIEFAQNWCLGCCVPLLVFGWYAAYNGIVLEAAKTFFVLPFAIATAQEHAPFARLADSVTRFLLYYRGIVFLALVGVALVHDDRSRTWRRIALVWLGAASLTILVQRQSWWQYHFLLLLPPIGIYATFGLAALAHRVRSSGYRGFAWLALCGVASYIAVPLPQAAIESTLRIASRHPYAGADALDRYRAELSGEYAQAARDAAGLERARPEPGGRGGVYVLGNPLIYVLSENEQALGINGWALQLYTPELWNELDRQLRARAPVHVFFGAFAQALIPSRSPATLRLLANGYTAVGTTSDGTWLRRNANS